MRNALAVILSLAAGVCATACADSAYAKTETITGKVVDLSCYLMNHEDSGMDHKTQGGATPPNVGFACAYSCVRWQGMPAGLLTSDGKVYQITGGLAENSNTKIAAHLTHTVTITGEVTELDGVMLIASNDIKMAQ